MAARQNNGNIRQYRKPFNINLGTFIFFLIFVYIIICVGSYLLRDQKVVAYRVQEGALSVDNIYTAIALREGNAEYARRHWDVLTVWANYLLKEGLDPDNQLCTDDFAGHLSHNVNLSAKAIMGIEAYARLAAQLGRTEEAEEYHAKAAEMAKDWEKRAIADDHYVLAFGNADTWSLKYNLVWDKLFGSKLFSDEVYEKELKYYVKKTNEYGTPLDSRKDYTKSDWILWCASIAKTDEEAQALIAPVAHYLEATATRVPFSDWYETVTGEYCHFMGRSVQGGIFMPVLMKKFGQ